MRKTVMIFTPNNNVKVNKSVRMSNENFPLTLVYLKLYNINIMIYLCWEDPDTL